MYQSIYRKYRPQTFNELYGQDAISTTLTNAIIHNRVAHAYLFSGPRGTGKTSSAKLLAKALNCTNIIDGKICDECENCLLIKSNSHPDVIEIDAASNNGVDEVRDLIEKVKYAPITGNKKVYIIDEIHMMSLGAFNALLKTLEEPPDHVVFILATTEIHKVLSTIKSRCQKFEFKKINEHDILLCLEDISNKEQVTYQQDALKIIASLSDGGMRDALSTLEQVMIYSNNDISMDAVYEVLDLVSQDRIEYLYNLIINQELLSCLNYINDLNQEGVDYKQVINELVKTTMNDLIEKRTNKADRSSINYLLNMIEKLDESLEKLKFDNSKKLYLELAIIKTINFNKVIQTQPEVVEYQEQAKQPSRPSVVETKPVVEQPIIEDTQEVVQEEVIQEEETQEQVIHEDIIEEDIIEEVKQPTNTYQPNINLVDESELMNVLVQATREDLTFVKEKWLELEDYLYNVNTKKYAGLLVGSIPVAASSNALILVTQDDSDVTLINNQNNIHPIALFIEESMLVHRYCFAINANDWQKLKDNYMQLRQINKLPKAMPTLDGIKLVEKIKEPIKTEIDETLEFSKKLFKDKLVLKREEDSNGY